MTTVVLDTPTEATVSDDVMAAGAFVLDNGRVTTTKDGTKISLPPAAYRDFMSNQGISPETLAAVGQAHKTLIGGIGLAASNRLVDEVLTSKTNGVVAANLMVTAVTNTEFGNFEVTAYGDRITRRPGSTDPIHNFGALVFAAESSAATLRDVQAYSRNAVSAALATLD